MTALLLSIALVGYTAGIVFAGLGMVYRLKLAWRAASILWAVTWAAHFGAILSLAVHAGHLPLTNLAEYLLVLGWAVLSLHLWVWYRLKVDVAGLILPPVAALAAFASWGLLSEGTTYIPVKPQGWFLFHTTVSTLGMATLGVAFAMSLLYLFQDRALKSKKGLGLVERLPALERCDQIGFHAMLVGFALLSVGIGTGVLMNKDLHERFWVLGAKQVFPMLAWIVFAAVIASRLVFGFRGRKSAYLTIAGFALGLLTMIGMTL